MLHNYSVKVGRLPWEQCEETIWKLSRGREGTTVMAPGWMRLWKGCGDGQRSTLTPIEHFLPHPSLALLHLYVRSSNGDFTLKKKASTSPLHAPPSQEKGCLCSCEHAEGSVMWYLAWHPFASEVGPSPMRASTVSGICLACFIAQAQQAPHQVGQGEEEANPA